MRRLLLSFLLPMTLLSAGASQGTRNDSGYVTTPRGVIRWQGLIAKIDPINRRIELTAAESTGAVPVYIEDTGSGTTWIAQRIECMLVQDSKGRYVVKSATLTGKAQVLLDSSIAARTAAEIAKKANLPAPLTPTEVTRTRLESDIIDYSLGADEAVLIFPKPVDYSSTSEGKGTRKREQKEEAFDFSQLTHVTGTKGRFTITPPTNAAPDVVPRTGHLDGPVKFTLIRTETGAAAAGQKAVPEVTNLSGQGDRFDANFVGEGDPTLKLTGNVTAEGAGQAFSGAVNGEEAIVTLDRVTRQPKSYEFRGQPAHTRVKVPPPVAIRAAAVVPPSWRHFDGCFSRPAGSRSNTGEDAGWKPALRGMVA